MLSKFLFSTVFACAAVPALSLALLSPACAQSALPGVNAAGDSLLLEMSQAFKRGDRKKLAQLLPQAKGHPLEPWAAYWEIKSRLGDAAPQEVQDFLARYAGSYQEDRLRNDWLLLLGQRRDWTTFEATATSTWADELYTGGAIRVYARPPTTPRMAMMMTIGHPFLRRTVSPSSR